MRVESVTARAFGPLVECSLTFAPGMTVIWGANEAGKSSWHAALYAGLCGMRRSKGSLRKDDREFAERYRPWSGEQWEVSAVVVLDSQRRVELQHDLEGKVDCRAVDAVLGRDVSAEIMHEGSPDAARWLGLDRRSFLAIACVRQADVLGVRNDPALLQDSLQRAAATAGTDATAAAAIARIDDFLRDQVGQDKANTSKPLRRARERVDAAKREVEQAHREHAAYLQLAARADELAAASATAARRLEGVHAARAAREAEVWRRRLDRVTQLAVRVGGGPPAGLVEDDRLAQDVAHAVHSWDERPEIPTLGGATAAELRTRIASLPGQLAAAAVRRQLGARAGWRAPWLAISAGTLLAVAGVCVVAVASMQTVHAATLLLLGLPLVATGAATIVWAVARGARSARQEALQELHAAEAARRAALEQQLADREAAEHTAHDAAARRLQAVEQLHAVAGRCGICGDDDRALAQGLRQWQQQRTAALEEQERQRQEWVELQTLLDGRTREELATETARRVQEADRLRADMAPEAVAAAGFEGNDAPPLDRLRQAAAVAAAEAAKVKGQAELQGRCLGSVAEAEEALNAAEEELGRVRRLADTLTQTREFLARAQERVHRDIARVLADTIRPWLPAVTAQRYGDVRIDPESLVVTVSGPGGEWHDAAWLSHGTAEQVYLLVRVALSTHLTKPGETCPLIFDDVTVQCDRERTLAVLQLLHRISRERQVILFSQEDEVLEWAQAHLRAPRDRLERLDARRIAA